MTSLPCIQIGHITTDDKSYITVAFRYNKDFLVRIRKIPTAKWSRTIRAWLIEDDSNHLDQIRQRFFKLALIDDSRYYRKKGKIQLNFNEDKKRLLNGFYRYLKGKRYSSSTIRTYVFSVADFIAFYESRSLSELQNRNVEIFIEQIYIKRKYSVSTQRQFISALKLFIQFDPSTQIDSLELVRPKKSKKLPHVLSQQDVITLIARCKNLKHRTIIAMLYSSGFRISELLQLKLKHINLERRQIFIQDSKGRKDRYVPLAESIIPLLQNYILTYQPQFYVIEGQPGMPYSSSSVRKFLKKYALQNNIKARVTPHVLRHSYATHLIENGVGIRHIQSLLGHAKPETTMIYTHIARKDLLDIKSPLDQAIEALQKSNKPEQNFQLSGN